MIPHFSSLCCPPFFRHADFAFIIIDVGELIVCGQTVEVIVYESAYIIFPFAL
jgi:hypothetical protein